MFPSWLHSPIRPPVWAHVLLSFSLSGDELFLAHFPNLWILPFSLRQCLSQFHFDYLVPIPLFISFSLFDFASSPLPLDLFYIYPCQSVLSLICFSFWYSSHDCHMSPSVTWLHWFLFLIIWFLPVSVALCSMLWKAYTYKSGLFPLFYLLEIPLFIKS